MIACMGGWCRKREQCAHYWAPLSKAISERLCPPKSDEPEPIRVIPIAA